MRCANAARFRRRRQRSRSVRCVFSAHCGHIVEPTCAPVTGAVCGPRMQAVNATGNGGAADTPHPIGAPTLTNSARGSQCIVFRWDAPSGKGAENILGYEMQTSADGVTGWTSHPGLLPAANGWFMDGRLRPGTDRYYRLRAVTTAGPGPWSLVLKDTTLVVDAPVMTATANGTNRIDLSWNAPSQGAGTSAHAEPCITGYQLQVSDTGTGWRELAGTLGRGERSYSHTGVSGGARKFYRVRALTTGAAGGWSKVVGAQATQDTGPEGNDNGSSAAGSQ